jgi:hypothetical protein
MLMTSGVAAMGQTPDTNGVTLLTTNRFPDGSTIKVEVVSYGVIHRVAWPFRKQQFFKSALPTIMFATTREALRGHYLDEGTNSCGLWTEAEALDQSGGWYPLRSRGEPRPVKEGMDDGERYFEGNAPTEMWEIWEFPKCPEPSASVRVRIWATRGEVKVSSVEFELPNDLVWRERIVKEETNTFHPQEWLNDELTEDAVRDLEYAKDLLAQGANPNARDSEGRPLLAIVCWDNSYREVTNVWSGTRIFDQAQLSRMAAAAYERRRGMVRVLIEGGADVNTRAGLGWTPLVLAARDGDIESVKYLLSKGADPNIKDELGESVIELTEQTRNTNSAEIIKILKSARATQ